MKSITSKKPRNALDSRAAVFVEKVAAGHDPRDAATLAGFASPANAARNLLLSPAVQWEIHARRVELDLQLKLKSRNVLVALLDSPLVAATVKARIAADVLKREAAERARAGSNNPISERDDSELEAEALELRQALNVSSDESESG